MSGMILFLVPFTVFIIIMIIVIVSDIAEATIFQRQVDHMGKIIRERCEDEYKDSNKVYYEALEKLGIDK